MRPDLRRGFVWMSAFYIAMAYLESAVVVNLRALYYPQGFNFPIVPMDRALVGAEAGRELATLLMLLAPAALITRSALERFAWFCFGFGVWDLFYYVWLKVLLGWPESLMTWDLLFLLPLPWVGPVWAPCFVSCGLIALALIILNRSKHVPDWRIAPLTWALLITGALIIISSFLLDPMEQGFTLGAMASADAPYGNYMPHRYPWEVFAAGAVAGGAGLLRAGVRR